VALQVAGLRIETGALNELFLVPAAVSAEPLTIQVKLRQKTARKESVGQNAR